MNDVRTILNEIKKIRGLENDTELAVQVGVSVHTLRSWVQNDSIRKPLILYCENRGISLDEVLLGRKRFNREACDDCFQKESCVEYRNVVDRPLTIGEGRLEPRAVIFNTFYSEGVQIDLYGENRIKSRLDLDLAEIEKMTVRLSSRITDENG